MIIWIIKHVSVDTIVGSGTSEADGPYAVTLTAVQQLRHVRLPEENICSGHQQTSKALLETSIVRSIIDDSQETRDEKMFRANGLFEWMKHGGGFSMTQIVHPGSMGALCSAAACVASSSRLIALQLVLFPMALLARLRAVLDLLAPSALELALPPAHSTDLDLL